MSYGLGGYGQSPYGLGFGGTDQPEIVSVLPILGTATLLIRFSTVMASSGPLGNPASYTVAPVAGIDGSPVTVIGASPVEPSGSGFRAVVLTLDTPGTTYGAPYTVSGDATITDILFNPLVPTPRAFLAASVTPAVTLVSSAVLASPVQSLVFESDVPFLDSSEHLGVEDLDSYAVDTYGYPIAPDLLSVALTDPTTLTFTARYLTSLEYGLVVGVAEVTNYDATELPSETPGTLEVGDGESEIVGSSGLLLRNDSGSFYGWVFEDTTGRITTAANLRATVSVSGVDPELSGSDDFLHFRVSDGATYLQAGVSPSGTVSISGGTYTASVPSAIADVTEPFTLGILRNDRVEFWTVIVDGVPIWTVPYAALTDNGDLSDPGSRITVTNNYTTFFVVDTLEVTASSTIFTTANNFFHAFVVPFTGPTALASDRIRTEFGPLVKAWGSQTPANVNDVTVRVNGTPIPLASVNPYVGEIFPAVPIPLTPPGLNTIEVDYFWYPNPTFELTRLNVPGLGLGMVQSNAGNFRHSVGDPNGISQARARSTQRFPYTVNLPSARKQDTLWIGHRFIGFEKSGTSALNSPTTLLTNNTSASPEYAEGVADMQSLSVPADLDQFTATGSATVTEVYDGEGEVIGVRVVDVTPTGGGLYKASLQINGLPGKQRVLLSARLQVSGYTMSGVFSGIAMGFHDTRRLVVLGALKINGVQHVGVLRNAGDLSDVSSWDVGPGVAATLPNRTHFVVSPENRDNVPVSLRRNDRLQIVEGPQSGVYTVEEVLWTNDGGATVLVNPPFPADPALFGNSEARVIFESRWDTASAEMTWRIETVDGGNPGQVFFQFGGNPSGSIVYGGPYPAPSSFVSTLDGLVVEEGYGEFFFGSFSRAGVSDTTWTRFRANVFPTNSPVEYSRGTVDIADPAVGFGPPDWAATSPFGVNGTNGTALTLRSWSPGSAYSMRRIDPFLSHKRVATVLAASVQSTRYSGSSTAVLAVDDTRRHAAVHNLVYRETGGLRYLVDAPTVSLDPNTVLDWQSPSFPTIESEPPYFILRPSATVGSSAVALSTSTEVSSTHRSLTFVVSRMTVAAFGSSAYLGFQVTLNLPERVTLRWTATGVRLASGGITVGPVVAYPWQGLQEDTTYRVSVDSTSVYLYINDTLRTTQARAAFVSVGVGTDVVEVSHTDATSVYEVYAKSLLLLPGIEPTGVARTIGVYVSGDPGEINSYRIPRSDASHGSRNSDAISATPVVMDWEVAPIEIQIHLDPTFGLVVERPDIPMPPGYDAEAFATQVTNPTRGWVTVEYRHLPYLPVPTGSVRVGNTVGGVVGSSTYEDFRYRIYTQSASVYANPMSGKMVLNRQSVINSGEAGIDTTPEVVLLTPITPTLINIWACHQVASSVFQVRGPDDAILTGWVFDASSQTITLRDPTTGPVTVVFSPGNPVTKTYLARQPFSQSRTKLNAGTPPFAASQTGKAIRYLLTGSADPGRPAEVAFEALSPLTTVQYADEAEFLYESLEMFEIRVGVPRYLTSICDGPVPGGLAVSVSGYHDQRVWLSDPQLQTAQSLTLSGGDNDLEQSVLNRNNLHTPGMVTGPFPNSSTNAIRDMVWIELIPVP